MVSILSSGGLSNRNWSLRHRPVEAQLIASRTTRSRRTTAAAREAIERFGVQSASQPERTRGRRVRCKDEMDSSPGVSGIIVPTSVGVMQPPKGGVRESSYDYRRGSGKVRLRDRRLPAAW